MSLVDDDDFLSPGEEADTIPDTLPSGELTIDRCDQCGAAREEWQDPEDTRCPRNAMPEPYASCDGTLRRVP